MTNLRNAIILEVLFATWVGQRAYDISNEWADGTADIRAIFVKRARALFAEG